MKIREKCCVKIRKVFLFGVNMEGVCAVCLVVFGLMSKNLSMISPTMEMKIKETVWPSFCLESSNHPKKICNSCKRNIYKIYKNDTEYIGSWISKVSEVISKELT